LNLNLCLIAACALAAAAAELPANEPTAATLRRATQALVGTGARDRRAAWQRYADPQLSYVTEDNEVRSRAQLLEDLPSLPPGSSGWIVLEDFRCTDFGGFAVTTYLMNERETVEGQELRARYRGSDTWRRTATGWRLVAAQLYVIAQDPPRAAALPARLTEYEGFYGLGALTRQSIRRDGDHLVAARPGREPQLLLRESGDVFFTPGRPRTRRIFTRTADGRVSGFTDRSEGSDLIWTRIVPALAAR
jgi:hypothetical protein